MPIFKIASIEILLALLAASAADTVELYIFAGNDVAVLAVDDLFYLGLDLTRYLDIFDRTAGVTNKMVVRLSYRLVHITVTPKMEAVCHTLINENIEVPIHVPETDRRELIS